MENEETNNIPGQEGAGAGAGAEAIVTEFATPIKFGGIEVKSEADVAKAQEAYVAQQARATKAEQEFAAYKAANPVKAKVAIEEKPAEEKPVELTFLQKQAKAAEHNKDVTTYVDGQFDEFKTTGNNSLLVEAFGDKAKATIKALVAQNGEESLKGLKIESVFDAVIKDAISKGNTPENTEAYNKAYNLRGLTEGTATVKEVQEVFEHFKKNAGKPAVAGEKINTFDLGTGEGQSDFNSKLEGINAKVKAGDLSPREGQREIKKLQKAHVKFK